MQATQGQQQKSLQWASVGQEMGWSRLVCKRLLLSMDLKFNCFIRLQNSQLTIFRESSLQHCNTRLTSTEKHKERKLRLKYFNPSEFQSEIIPH